MDSHIMFAPIHFAALPMPHERETRHSRRYEVLTAEISRMQGKIDTARSYGQREDMTVYREIIAALKIMKIRSV